MNDETFDELLGFLRDSYDTGARIADTPGVEDRMVAWARDFLSRYGADVTDPDVAKTIMAVYMQVVHTIHHKAGHEGWELPSDLALPEVVDQVDAVAMNSLALCAFAAYQAHRGPLPAGQRN